MVSPSLVRLAYSASQVPASTPIGVAMAMPRKLMIRLPTIALARPPSSPLAVIPVNSLKFSALMPWRRVSHRIQARKVSPISVAKALNPIASQLVMRRRR
jgi:hypothetical protein